MSNKEGEMSKIVPEVRASKLINLRLTEKELRILEVIRTNDEDYEDAIKRALWESFEYSLVRDAISAIDDRLTDLISERIYEEQGSYSEAKSGASAYGYEEDQESYEYEPESRHRNRRNTREDQAGPDAFEDDEALQRSVRRYSNPTQPHISQKAVDENLKASINKAMRYPRQSYSDDRPSQPQNREVSKGYEEYIEPPGTRKEDRKTVNMKEMLERKWIKVGNGAHG